MIYLLPRYGVHGLFYFYIFSFPQIGLMALIILSGFFITYDSLNLIQRNNFQLPVKLFFFKRLTRLYPALIFSLLITVIVFLIITHGCLSCTYHNVSPNIKFSFLNSASLPPKNYFSTLFFLQGIFIGKDAPVMNLPLWTLSYEFWYYILFVLIASIITRKHRKLGACMFAFIIIYMIAFNHLRFLLVAFIWLSGALIALAYRSNKLFSNEANQPIFLLFALLVIICTVSYWVDGRNVFVPSGNVGYFIQTCLALILALIIAIIIRLNVSFKKTFCKKLATYSRSSYTLYVLHYPILLMSFHFTWPHIQHWPTLAIALVIVVYSLLIIYFSKKCATVLENKALFRRALSPLFLKRKYLETIEQATSSVNSSATEEV